jgi:hypothetical protein
MSKTQLVENCYKNRSFYIMRGADSEHFSPIPEVDSDLLGYTLLQYTNGLICIDVVNTPITL